MPAVSASKVVATLRNAFIHKTLGATALKGFILHSDRGCQFLSDEYHALVKGSALGMFL